MKVLLLGCKDYPAFATPWVHSGGMEVYVERLVRSLHDRARFTLYTAGGHSDDAARVIPLGAARGIRTQPLSLTWRSRKRLSGADGPFDVVNPHTPLAALAAREAKLRWGIPYVVTVHVFGANTAHAGGRVAAAFYGAVERIVFSAAETIVPTGRRLAEAIAQRHPGVRDRIHPVTPAGDGVYPTAPRGATRQRLDVSEDAPVLLFLGRLIAENGLDDLVAAFTRLSRRMPRAELWIAGAGGLEEATRRRVREAGCDGRVRWMGSLRGQEKLDVLAAADLLVRFSRHEVFPEAYLEALAVGTPVVATPAGDTPDLAAASQAIALVPPGDPEVQARIVEQLLRNDDVRSRMQRKGLDYSSRFRWERQREVYWHILEEAAGR